LTAEFEKHIALVKKEHMDPRDEAAPPYVEKHLGGLLAVSSAVIHKQIEKEQLWARL